MKKTTKKQKPITTSFEPGRQIGAYGNLVVIADMYGKLWRLDMEAGQLVPVTLKTR